jgi:hypothetical protein
MSSSLFGMRVCCRKALILRNDQLLRKDMMRDAIRTTRERIDELRIQLVRR